MPRIARPASLNKSTKLVRLNSRCSLHSASRASGKSFIPSSNFRARSGPVDGCSAVSEGPSSWDGTRWPLSELLRLVANPLTSITHKLHKVYFSSSARSLQDLSQICVASRAIEVIVKDSLIRDALRGDWRGRYTYPLLPFLSIRS